MVKLNNFHISSICKLQFLSLASKGAWICKYAIGESLLDLWNLVNFKDSSLKPSEEGEHYGLVPFGSIANMVNILCSNIANIPFTRSLTCRLHIFYLNSFIKVK